MDVPSPSESVGEDLVKAAMMEDVSSIAQLLGQGVDPSFASVKGESGMTALMWASVMGSLPIAQKLVDAGADVNAKDSKGMSALIFAAENLPSLNPREAPPSGFPDRPPSKDDKPPPPQIPITISVTGHADIVRLLLKQGADVSLRNSMDDTFLHLTTRRAQDGLVREFLARGVSIESRNSGFLETPLHVAAKENHLQLVRMLCDLGAQLEVRNRFRWTPLLLAAANGWDEVVAELIQRGADVNVSADGHSGPTTALKEARRCQKPDVVSKMLIRAGAIE